MPLLPRLHPRLSQPEAKLAAYPPPTPTASPDSTRCPAPLWLPPWTAVKVVAHGSSLHTPPQLLACSSVGPNYQARFQVQPSQAGPRVQNASGLPPTASCSFAARRRHLPNSSGTASCSTKTGCVTCWLAW